MKPAGRRFSEGRGGRVRHAAGGGVPPVPGRRSRFVLEYLKSLKPWETEELINQFFNRPIAYLAAEGFKRLGASPNLVTVVSMCFGVASGYFFARGDFRSGVVAAALLELMIIFDCADGQLARILGKSSQLGKTLDGLADMVTHFSIFYGTAYALSARSGTLFPYLLAAMAQLSMYLHIIFYDHFKNVFISISYPEYEDRFENLEKLRERAAGGSGIRGLLARLYYLFYKFEMAIASVGYLPPVSNFYEMFPEPDKLSPDLKRICRSEMRPALRLWSFQGDTIHLTLFIFFALVGRMSFLFPTILIVFNIYTVFVIVYQRSRFGQLGVIREAIGQAGAE